MQGYNQEITIIRDCFSDNVHSWPQDLKKIKRVCEFAAATMWHNYECDFSDNVVTDCCDEECIASGFLSGECKPHYKCGEKFTDWLLADSSSCTWPDRCCCEKKCQTNSDCDDSNSCTTDTCNSESCSNQEIIPCCGNGKIETGEECDGSSNCDANCKCSQGYHIENGNCVVDNDCNAACMTADFPSGSCDFFAGWFGCSNNKVQLLGFDGCSGIFGSGACCCEENSCSGICANPENGNCPTGGFSIEGTCSSGKKCCASLACDSPNQCKASCDTANGETSTGQCLQSDGNSGVCCAPSSPGECIDGQVQDCTTSTGQSGTQTCANGAWGECRPKCQTNSDCDDSNSCTTDTCNADGSCSNTPITPCCGNGKVEMGEECETSLDIFCRSDCKCSYGYHARSGSCHQCLDELNNPTTGANPDCGDVSIGYVCSDENCRPCDERYNVNNINPMCPADRPICKSTTCYACSPRLNTPEHNPVSNPNCPQGQICLNDYCTPTKPECDAPAECRTDCSLAENPGRPLGGIVIVAGNCPNEGEQCCYNSCPENCQLGDSCPGGDSVIPGYCGTGKVCCPQRSPCTSDNIGGECVQGTCNGNTINAVCPDGYTCCRNDICTLPDICVDGGEYNKCPFEIGYGECDTGKICCRPGCDETLNGQGGINPQCQANYPNEPVCSIGDCHECSRLYDDINGLNPACPSARPFCVSGECVECESNMNTEDGNPYCPFCNICEFGFDANCVPLPENQCNAPECSSPNQCIIGSSCSTGEPVSGDCGQGAVCCSPARDCNSECIRLGGGIIGGSCESSCGENSFELNVNLCSSSICCCNMGSQSNMQSASQSSSTTTNSFSVYTARLVNESSLSNGIAYQFGPSGFHFDTDVSVTVKYQGTEFNSGDGIYLYKFSDNILDNCTYTVLNNVHSLIDSYGGIVELDDAKIDIPVGAILSPAEITINKLWVNCNGENQECTSGNKQECLAENGCYGTQDCINGQWDARCTSNMQKCGDNVCRLFCNSNPNFLAGKINQAYNFDGYGDYINLGNNPILQVASGDFSLCAWFKTLGDEEDIISNGVFGDGDYLLMSYQGRLRGHVWYQGNGNVLDSNAIVNDNNWHLGCQVVNANTNTLYVDGILDNSIALAGSKVSGNSNVVIGSRDAASSNYNFQGLLDDVRIYNRALSGEEIQSLYELQDVSEGLAGHWKLDGDASDSSGNGNNGALITGAVIGGKGSWKIALWVVIGLLVIFAILLMLRKKKRKIRK